MASKKKAGSHKSRLKQQKLQADSQLLNDAADLALPTPPLPCTVHATVPSNSNSNFSPLITSTPNYPHLNPSLPSPSHDLVSQEHVDPSPNINHVFVKDCLDDAAYDNEEVDFNSSVEDYDGGYKFFTTPVFAETPGLYTPLWSLSQPLLSPPPVLMLPWLLSLPCLARRLLWIPLSL
jgi:hypothetical protein